MHLWIAIYRHGKHRSFLQLIIFEVKMIYMPRKNLLPCRKWMTNKKVQVHRNQVSILPFSIKTKILSYQIILSTKIAKYKYLNWLLFIENNYYIHENQWSQIISIDLIKNCLFIWKFEEPVAIFLTYVLKHNMQRSYIFHDNHYYGQFL